MRSSLDLIGKQFHIIRYILIATVLCFLNPVLGLEAQSVKNQIISIETVNTEIIISVRDKRAYFEYYGKRFHGEEVMLNINHITETRGAENNIILLSQLYPSNGFGNVGESAIKVTHADGNLTTDLLFHSYEKNKISDNLISHEIVLKDGFYNFYVKLKFDAYQAEDVITQSAEIWHTESAELPLSQFYSSFLEFTNDDYFLTYFYGSWSKEMVPQTEKLTRGIKSLETKRGVRTTQTINPYVILSKNKEAEEFTGECFGLSLAWSGNFKLLFEVDDKKTLNVLGGINPHDSEIMLKANEPFKTPEAVWTYSATGKNTLSQNLHKWVRKNALRDGYTPRPIMINNWSGTGMQFDEKLITDMIDDAADMKLEMFVLDDGWFGNEYPRNNAKAGLGDWQVNKKKLPKGLSYLAKYAEKSNLDFGIWVEPEMVNPNSNLAKNHPDWIVTNKHREPILWRNQLLLDLTNPEVVDFVFDVVDNVLTENPKIKYVKWDANRHVENFGSNYLSKANQSHFFTSYVHNLYGIYEKLEKKYPNIIFQVCSSGGGRVDYGSLKYHHEFWPSDNIDPLERIRINWGFSYFYPSIAIASHVSSSPNHQTGRKTPIKFRYDVSMAERLGLELVPSNMTQEERAFSKQAIQVYKNIRDIVQLGTLYRLNTPYDDDGFSSISYVNETKKKAVLFAYSTEHHLRNEYKTIKLAGLDAKKNYKITEVNQGKSSFYGDSGKVFSGDYLMKFGVLPSVTKVYDSCVLLLEEQ